MLASCTKFTRLLLLRIFIEALGFNVFRSRSLAAPKYVEHLFPSPSAELKDVVTVS